MPITLVTGLPGAGKTINTLQLVLDECPDRQVYYRGIPDLQLPWTELTDDQVKHWYDYPEGSVFVIDEVHQVFPNTRKALSDIPPYIQRLDTHRHHGYDFYFITQKPTQLDHGARGFIGRHYHYERQFGMDSTRRLAWEHVVDNPKDDYHSRQNAITKRIRFPKKLYSQYRSSTMHTVKRRIPGKVFVLGGLLVGVVAFGAAFLNDVQTRKNLLGDDAQPEIVFDDQEGPIQIKSDQFGSQSILTPSQYMDRFEPRVEGFPHTAPAYDELTKVKTFPRPQCMMSQERSWCQCFTQQATPIEMTFGQCVNIVQNGWFNPYLEENDQRRQPGAGASGAPRPGETPQTLAWSPDPVEPTAQWHPITIRPRIDG